MRGAFLVRLLRARGFAVTYVQNITNVDDKIIRRARELGIDVSELARMFERAYLDDMRALRNDSVDAFIACAVRRGPACGGRRPVPSAGHDAQSAHIRTCHAPPSAASRSSQARSHRRHSSAHSRQCSW
jgi:hypothetical protein